MFNQNAARELSAGRVPANVTIEQDKKNWPKQAKRLFNQIMSNRQRILQCFNEEQTFVHSGYNCVVLLSSTDPAPTQISFDTILLRLNERDSQIFLTTYWSMRGVVQEKSLPLIQIAESDLHPKVLPLIQIAESELHLANLLASSQEAFIVKIVALYAIPYHRQPRTIVELIDALTAEENGGSHELMIYPRHKNVFQASTANGFFKNFSIAYFVLFTVMRALITQLLLERIHEKNSQYTQEELREFSSSVRQYVEEAMPNLIKTTWVYHLPEMAFADFMRYVEYTYEHNINLLNACNEPNSIPKALSRQQAQNLCATLYSKPILFAEEILLLINIQTKHILNATEKFDLCQHLPRRINEFFVLRQQQLVDAYLQRKNVDVLIASQEKATLLIKEIFENIKTSNVLLSYYCHYVLALDSIEFEQKQFLIENFDRIKLVLNKSSHQYHRLNKLCSFNNGQENAVSLSGEILNEDPEFLEMEWSFLGNGGANFAYKSQDGKLVFKYMQHGNDNDPAYANIDRLDFPERAVRIWNEINSTVTPPARVCYALIEGVKVKGWVAPYIEGSNVLSDSELYDSVIDLFDKKGRIFLDAPIMGNIKKLSNGESVGVDFGWALLFELYNLPTIYGRMASIDSGAAWTHNTQEMFNANFARWSAEFPKTVTALKALIFIQFIQKTKISSLSLLKKELLKFNSLKNSGQYNKSIFKNEMASILLMRVINAIEQAKTIREILLCLERLTSNALYYAFKRTLENFISQTLQQGRQLISRISSVDYFQDDRDILKISNRLSNTNYVPISEEFQEEHTEENNSDCFSDRTIASIKAYYTRDISKVKERFFILLDLINSTLLWVKNAKSAGLVISVLNTADALQKMCNQITISLDEAYPHLYTIFYSVIFSTRLQETKFIDIKHFAYDAAVISKQLRQMVKENRLPAHTHMVRQENNLKMLTHRDESNVPYYDKHYLTDNIRKEWLSSAINILEKLPNFWSRFYVHGYDEQNSAILEVRCQIEAICAAVLADILNKNPKTLIIEEQCLVMLALSGYFWGETHSPFDNAVRLLAITDPDIKTEISLVGSELAEAQEVAVFQKLCTHLRYLFNYDDALLTLQQHLFDKAMWQTIQNIMPDSYRSERIDYFDPSVFLNKSGISRKSLTLSQMREKGKNKRNTLNYMRFNMVWSALHALTRPFKMREVEFILKSFEKVYQNTDFNKAHSVELLNRAFDWLHNQPSAQHGFSVFGGPKEEVPSEDWKNVMKFLETNKKLPLLFARYCVYQVDKRAAGYHLKSYEIKYMMIYLKQLYIHKNALNMHPVMSVSGSTLGLGEYLAPITGQTNTSAISLVYKMWNKELKQLEKNAELGILTREEVEVHRERLRDDTNPAEPRRIVFETRLGGMSNQILSVRISSLRDKANALAAKTAKSTSKKAVTPGHT